MRSKALLYSTPRSPMYKCGTNTNHLNIEGKLTPIAAK
jgi:hypothetical protein